MVVSYEHHAQATDGIVNFVTLVQLDKKDMKTPVGKPMTETGGSIVVGESERYSGVGHCGVYEMNGKWHIIAHGYDKAKNGASKLFLRELRWDGGWPTVVE